MFLCKCITAPSVSISGPCWSMVKIGPRPIPKRHHRPALATVADASADDWCVLGLNELIFIRF